MRVIAIDARVSTALDREWSRIKMHVSPQSNMIQNIQRVMTEANRDWMHSFVKEGFCMVYEYTGDNWCVVFV